MNHVELMEHVELTDAEKHALRIVVNGEGRAGWYQVGRVVTPTSYPEQETRPMRILNRLKEADLIAETPGGKGHLFTATARGVEYLSAEALGAEHMNYAELTGHVELTEAEKHALRIVASSNGRASWYQVERLVTPLEYPGQDTNSVRILARLEQAGLIAETPGGGHMRPFTATMKGMKRLDVETKAK